VRPLKLLKTAIPLAILAALAVAGCGGGGSDSTSTAVTTTETTALSKADLISQGDSICGEVNAAVASTGGSEAEAAQQAVQVGLYVDMVERIKRLGAPDEPAGYAEFIAAAEELSKVEGEVKLAAEREDAVALEEATTNAAPALEEFQTQAAVYGFKDCSEGPHAPTPSGSGAPAEEAEEGGVEGAPEGVEEEVAPEEVAPEEVAPETGGAGGEVEEVAPETGGGSGGVGPG
jgi:hypothetical protein